MSEAILAVSMILIILRRLLYSHRASFTFR